MIGESYFFTKTENMLQSHTVCIALVRNEIHLVEELSNGDIRTRLDLGKL